MSDDYAIIFEMTIEGATRVLHPVVREALRRIGDEAIVNAFRHSGASIIEIVLSYHRAALLMGIRDDGIGIAPDIAGGAGRKGHFGLAGMRERASQIGADYKLSSRAESGTEIHVRVLARIAYDLGRGLLYRRLLDRLMPECTMANPTPSAIRVLVVDDHPVLRAGIAAIIAGQADMVLVGEAGNGAEAVAQHRLAQPDVTLMDLQMPRMNGVDAITAIRKDSPRARIVVLTTYAGEAQALRAIKAGAVGYLLKSAVRKELLDTVREIHAGRRHIPADIAQDIAFNAVQESLSDREISILNHVAAGKANKEIGWLLTISEDTVKAHLRSIFAKLEASDRTQAVTSALRRGIIEL